MLRKHLELLHRVLAEAEAVEVISGRGDVEDPLLVLVNAPERENVDEAGDLEEVAGRSQRHDVDRRVTQPLTGPVPKPGLLGERIRGPEEVWRGQAHVIDVKWHARPRRTSLFLPR